MTRTAYIAHCKQLFGQTMHNPAKLGDFSETWLNKNYVIRVSPKVVECPACDGTGKWSDGLPCEMCLAKGELRYRNGLITARQMFDLIGDGTIFNRIVERSLRKGTDSEVVKLRRGVTFEMMVR